MLNSLLSLEKETGESIWAYNKEISFMRKLILEGKWAEAEEFFKPLEKNNTFAYKEAMLALKKQSLFELIENGDNIQENTLECHIKEIKAISSKEAFEEIMKCLNVTSINEMERYSDWTVINGRFECFDNVKELLLNVYPSILATGSERKVKIGLMNDVMNKMMELVNRDKAPEKRIKSLIEAAEVFVNINQDNGNDKYVTFNPQFLHKEIKKEEIPSGQPQANSKTTEEPVHSINSIHKKEKEPLWVKKDKSFKDVLSNTDLSPYCLFNYDVSSYKLDLMISDTNPIRTSCFSPKGDFFALGTNSKSLKIYDMNNVLTQFNSKTSTNTTIPLVFEKANHHLGSLYCLDWSKSSKLIASGSNDKAIKIIVVPDLISWSNKSNILELSMQGHTGTVRSLVFDPLNDHSLYSGGTVDKSIFIWDTETGTSKAQLNGHSNDIHAIKWSNDSQLLGSSGKDKTINFWDVKSSQVISTIKAVNYDDINDISIMTLNHNKANSIVAAAHNGGMVTIWDYHTKNLIKEIPIESKSEMRSIAFSPDGKYLLVGGFNKKISLIDINDNYKVKATLEHLDKVVSVKWHPEKPIIVSTSADKTARIWLPQLK